MATLSVIPVAENEFTYYNRTFDWLAGTTRSSHIDIYVNLSTEPPEGNWTVFPAGYPSGYTWPHIICASVSVTIVILMILIGNFLVIWAIYFDRNLKATQNLFIASLALADFLLGLVVIPFSLANEIMGYWHFGTIWCELWKAADVLLCTASISSLCLISLDRYWSITRAMTYSSQRTPKRAAIMIAVIWIVSAAVCIPPLIGWKQPERASEWPICSLSEDIGYALYSAIGSFFIPAIIMVFVYYKIYQAAKERARKSVAKKPTATSGGKEQKHSNESSLTDPPAVETSKNQQGKENQTKHTLPAHVTSSDCESNPTQTAEMTTVSQSVHNDEMTKLISTDSDSCDVSLKTFNRGDNPYRLNTVIVLTSDTESSSEQQNRSLLGSGGKDRDINTTDPDNGEIHQFMIVESKQNGSLSVVHPGKEKRNTPFLSNITRHLFNANRQKKKPKKHDEDKIASIDQYGTEKHKRKLAKARERRATVVLGLVMAAFILCWLPFFTLYVASAFCSGCIHEMVFTVFFWIGYANSALNPIIYTVFNRDFRRAFGKIIFGKKWARGR
ncbi:alpha-2A adrenergic receptor-like [Gigantopelta aegis]|uniref:alpha-2A adrenergic receptor-like n=1 Tax=Gigantopelta aegis TaxID=1735272 RepID=UPI001B88A99E|nr:alpha-2A adrenergic receptor-like [Gigantopelta aegis]